MAVAFGNCDFSLEGRNTNMIKTAVIGVGNMGSKYASILQDGFVEGMELAALTRVKDSYKELLHGSLEKVAAREGQSKDGKESAFLYFR